MSVVVMSVRDKKRLDKAIEAAYYRRCSGIVIDIMDIGKVFEVGRQAALAGENMEEAIVAFVQKIRRN